MTEFIRVPKIDGFLNWLKEIHFNTNTALLYIYASSEIPGSFPEETPQWMFTVNGQTAFEQASTIAAKQTKTFTIGGTQNKTLHIFGNYDQDNYFLFPLTSNLTLNFVITDPTDGNNDGGSAPYEFAFLYIILASLKNSPIVERRPDLAGAQCTIVTKPPTKPGTPGTNTLNQITFSSFPPGNQTIFSSIAGGRLDIDTSRGAINASLGSFSGTVNEKTLKCTLPPHFFHGQITGVNWEPIVPP